MIINATGTRRGGGRVKPLPERRLSRHPEVTHHERVTMTNSTPDQDSTDETQAPTPASGDAGEVEAITPEQVHTTGDTDPVGDGEVPGEVAGEASTPDQAASPEQADADEIPDNDELEEPSTEKDPGEEPKAPSRDEPEPDHEAIGIGVDEPPTV
jgi:hypothetical protein